jgi:hypothetical protein
MSKLDCSRIEIEIKRVVEEGAITLSIITPHLKEKGDT